MIDTFKLNGYIVAKIKHRDTGYTEIRQFNNNILSSGKEYLIKCLLDEFPKLHVKFMLFGDGGTENGQVKEISPMQDKLFGVTRIKKTVVSQIDPEFPTQVIFSTSVGEDEGNNFSLNEMALELSNGTLLNLSTFSDLNKTDQMEIDWSWVIIFV